VGCAGQLPHQPALQIMLRDYQQNQYRGVIEAARQGVRRICVASPTGTGKTEVMAELCRVAQYPVVIEHLVDLVTQTHARLEKRLDERVDIEQGARFAEGIDGLRSRVIVGSRDSMLSRKRFTLRAYNRETLVIVDECHHGTTARMQEMLEYFENRGATIVGFSATPYKGKGKALRYWPRPQIVYSLRQALDDAYLVPPNCRLSEAKSFDFTLVDEVAGEWNKAQLAAVLTAEHCCHEVSSLVLSTFKQQPSVVYAACVSQAKLIAEMFERYGIKVSLVHSKQDLVTRKANMDAFVSGESKIIINVGILSCGWDFPELRNVYMAAPCRALSRYEQRIGRGMRTLTNVLQPGMTLEERRAAIAASDKPFFNLYDLSASSATHQLRNVYDVLDAASRTNQVRRQRLAATITEAGVDPIEAIKQLDELEKLEMEDRLAELKEKRRNLMIGVTFDHTSRDLFSDPQKAGRGWRMMYGKYKGEKLSSIPTDYLQWVADSQKKHTPFKSAVVKEIKHRRREQHKS